MTLASMSSTQNKSRHDRFLSTMTFANMAADCDCDECDLCEMPPEVAAAVSDHKRQKMLNDYYTTISQERSLVVRHDGLSVWKLVMPPGAEPLIEYGNSHRFVFVEYMPSDRTVKSIGRGIIGSSNEESSRLKEDWREKGCYLYRSNGGKAIGWVNDRQGTDKDLNVSDMTNDVVLYYVKATEDILEEWRTSCATASNNPSMSSPSEINHDADVNADVNAEVGAYISADTSFPKWVSGILEIFEKYIILQEEGIQTDHPTSSSSESRKSNTEEKDALIIRQLIDPFVVEDEEK